jgi:hypothetical protein
MMAYVSQAFSNRNRDNTVIVKVCGQQAKHLGLHKCGLFYVSRRLSARTLGIVILDLLPDALTCYNLLSLNIID